MSSNIRDNVVFSSPRTDGERIELASACIRDLGIELPALIDSIDDSTEQAYTGWPDRLYVIDSEGRVAYKSKPGPFGFKPTELEAALTSAIAGSPASSAN